MPWFAAGTVITTPRHQVDVVVTEHGAADLRGLDRTERAAALVELWARSAAADLTPAGR